MPKGNELYPVRLDFFVSEKMRKTVIAIAHSMGAKGKASVAARKLINLGIEQYLEGMKPKKRAEYDLIMSRLNLIEGIEADRKAETDQAG